MCEGARATLANNHLACYAPPPTSPHWEVDLRMGDFAEQKLVLTATAVIINIKGGGVAGEVVICRGQPSRGTWEATPVAARITKITAGSAVEISKKLGPGIC